MEFSVFAKIAVMYANISDRFLSYRSKLKLYRASSVMLVALIPCFIVFRLILDIPLWPGLLPKFIPGIVGGGSIPPLT